MIRRRIKAIKDQRKWNRDGQPEVQARSLFSLNALTPYSIRSIPLIEKPFGASLVSHYFFPDRVKMWGLDQTPSRPHPAEPIMIMGFLQLFHSSLDFQESEDLEVYTINVFCSYFGVTHESFTEYNNPEALARLCFLPLEILPDDTSGLQKIPNDTANLLLSLFKKDSPEKWEIKFIKHIPASWITIENLNSLKGDAISGTDAVRTAVIQLWNDLLIKPSQLIFFLSVANVYSQFRGFRNSGNWYLQCLFHLLMVVRSGGNVSSSALSKRYNSLRQDLGLSANDYEIPGSDDPTIVQRTCVSMKNLLEVNGLTLDEVINALQPEVSVLSKRSVTLVPLLAQAALAGQTTINLILQVVEILGNDLIWLIINQLKLKAEFHLFLKYIQELDKNVHLGIHVPGISRQLVNLSYLACQILIKYNGQSNLNDYRGIGGPTNKTPVPLKAFIDSFVTKKIAERGDTNILIPKYEDRIALLQTEYDLSGMNQLILNILQPINQSLLSAEAGDAVPEEQPETDLDQKYKSYFHRKDSDDSDDDDDDPSTGPSQRSRRRQRDSSSDKEPRGRPPKRQRQPEQPRSPQAGTSGEQSKATQRKIAPSSQIHMSEPSTDEEENVQLKNVGNLMDIEEESPSDALTPPSQSDERTGRTRQQSRQKPVPKRPSRAGTSSSTLRSDTSAGSKGQRSTRGPRNIDQGIVCTPHSPEHLKVFGALTLSKLIGKPRVFETLGLLVVDHSAGKAKSESLTTLIVQSRTVVNEPPTAEDSMVLGEYDFSLHYISDCILEQLGNEPPSWNSPSIAQIISTFKTELQLMGSDKRIITLDEGVIEVLKKGKLTYSCTQVRFITQELISESQESP